MTKHIVEFNDSQIKILSNFLQLLVVAGLEVNGTGDAIPTKDQLKDVWQTIVKSMLSKSNMEVQTRSNAGEIRTFPTFKEALDFAKDSVKGKGWYEKAGAVWKISFSLPNGERIRLTRLLDSFVLDQMEDAMARVEQDKKE